MTSDRGVFITFEGPEGAGKTTQIGLLATSLQNAGYNVTRTREPGGDVVGERVRELLLHAQIVPEAELLLFAAARAQNVQTVVRPALLRGDVVLCDRFTDSTLAYQGAGRGLPAEVIAQVNPFATGGLFPDVTLLLDLPPADGLARQNPDAQNRMDKESMAFHKRVRAAFLELQHAEPNRIVLVNASLPVPEVAAKIWQTVQTVLPGATEASPTE